jgi:hypothetical protein
MGIDRTEDLRAFGEVFRKHDTCKKVKGRSKITSIDGRYTWRDEISLQQLRIKGTAFLHDNHLNHFKNPVPNSVLLCNEDPNNIATDSQDDYTQQSIEETKESIALLGEDDDVEDCVYNSDDDDDGDDDDDELVVDNNSSSSSATNY